MTCSRAVKNLPETNRKRQATKPIKTSAQIGQTYNVRLRSKNKDSFGNINSAFTISIVIKAFFQLCTALITVMMTAEYRCGNVHFQDLLWLNFFCFSYFLPIFFKLKFDYLTSLLLRSNERGYEQGISQLTFDDQELKKKN